MSVCRGRTLVGAGQGSQRFGRKRHSAGSVAGRGARRAGAAGRGGNGTDAGKGRRSEAIRPYPMKKKRSRSDRNLLKIRDSDRIQTCNLLIRSQVLYSVKLRSHSLIASANVGYFSGLCKFFADKIYPTRKMALWKSGMSAVAGFCGRWAAERVRGSHGGKSGSRQGGERCPAMRE